MYIAEMARKDYEENNLVVKATKHYVKFAERMIEKKAKEGRNQWEFGFVDSSPMKLLFDKCVPNICQELTERGFKVTVNPNRNHKGYCISFKW